MITVDLKNTEPAPKQWPKIFDYQEDINKLSAEIAKIGSFQKIIVIGNGGSITSYDAYIGALSHKLESKTVWSMDPAMLTEVRKECPAEKTVVFAISKSGNTLGQIESLLNFIDYKVVCVTQAKDSTLYQIAKRKGFVIIPHPDIGGRFSGNSACAYAPALAAGIKAAKIQTGFKTGYKNLRNMAYTLAKSYFELEKQGYSEVYISIYPYKLANTANLIIQLMHESVCKDGQGQTFYVSMGPECQHHTNQRFLGGKKNVIGTFIVTEISENSENNKISTSGLSGISYKGKKLEFLNGISYSRALAAEYQGTKDQADKLLIPNFTISLDKIDENSIGEFISFWQMVAFYSSILRGVNPFDQPAVEDSKNITLQILLNKR